MSATVLDDLSRTRALFEHWRATRSGRGKIPEELWQAVIALRDRYSASPLCRELHLSAGALRARLQEAEAQSSSAATAEFVPLRLETLTAGSGPTSKVVRSFHPSGLGTG